MFKFFTTVIFEFAIAGLSHAQDSVTIKGIVMDEETNQTIPFAHVIIGEKVNITNLNGEFAFEFSTSFKELELKVLYVGYQDHTQIITDFDEDHTIYMKPSATKLDDISVMSGPYIMNRVIDRLHINYLLEPLLIHTQYHESVRDTAGYFYTINGLIDVYTPSNIDYKKSPVARVVNAEKIIHQEFNKTFIMDGNACDMADATIWKQGSVLNDENKGNYDYFYSGTKKMDQHNTLIVDFEPKSKSGLAKGRLYIDEVTYGIVGMEYEPIIEKSSFWNEVKWTEEYKFIDGVFQLNQVTYKGLAMDKSLTYEASLNVSHIEIIYNVPSEATMTVNDALFDIVDETVEIIPAINSNNIRDNDHNSLKMK